mmetsp:Transcript_21825/g.16176  ORF Transcript_21825/g.16176 Transcript_21825/m.16176 type:complete len:140 (+) Transcript_21825:358-777(+)
MKDIYSKVERTVNEKTDSAVYSIKASINFTDTHISDNDVFLSASTSSKVAFEDCSLTDIDATGQVIQLVSSTLYLTNVIIENIIYSTTSSFYKISIVNKSAFYANKLTLLSIQGPLFYVSGATFSLTNDTLIEDCYNDD